MTDDAFKAAYDNAKERALERRSRCHVCDKPSHPDFFIIADGKDRPLCSDHAASLLRHLFRRLRDTEEPTTSGFQSWQLKFDMDDDLPPPEYVNPRQVREWLDDEKQNDTSQFGATTLRWIMEEK